MRTISRGNPFVRVWKPVYEVYKAIADDYGMRISDLVSTILVRVATENPSLIKVIGVEEFGLDYNDAWDMAADLEDLMNEALKKAWERAQEMIEEMEKEKKMKNKVSIPNAPQ